MIAFFNMLRKAHLLTHICQVDFSTGLALGYFFFRHHFRQFDLFYANSFKSEPFFATFWQINPMI